MAIDRIHPLKLEDPTSGGTQTDQFPTSANKNEDYVDVRGISFQSTTSDDEAYYFSRDDSDNIDLFTSSAVRFRVTSGGDFIFSGGGYTFNGSTYDINCTGAVTLSGSSITMFNAYSFPTALGTSGDFLALSGSSLIFKEGGSSTSVFAVTTGVVHTVSGVVTYASDSFVFGSPQLNDDGNVAHDGRFFFDKATSSFRAGKTTSTEWDTRGNYSFACGLNCVASAESTFCGGSSSSALTSTSFSFGYSNETYGTYSYSFGYSNTSKGSYSSTEGFTCTAGASNNEANSAAHAEGYNTTATGTYGSHSEGRVTTASGQSSHSEGYTTVASGNYSHVEGYYTRATGSGAHAEGYGNGTASYEAAATASHVEGYQTNATTGAGNHAEGANSSATGNSACHAEGYYTLASGANSHSEGSYSTASGQGSHAEGYGSSGNKNIASSQGSHVEGYECDATTGYGNHAEGYQTQATGAYGAHSEGSTTAASGQTSHAEGDHTIASSSYSHAEGYYTTASGQGSHSEGRGANGDPNVALGDGSHAEGYYTSAGTAAADYGAHSEGMHTTAEQAGTHAEGAYCTATKDYSHAEGYYATARYLGTHAAASGRRSSELGSLQRELIEVARLTTDSVADTALLPNQDAGNDIVVPSNYIYDAYIQITGVVVSTTGAAATGDTAIFTMRGAVKNKAGTSSLVYCNKVIEDLDAAMATCDANIEYSGNSMRFVVNGLSDAVIQWHGTVIITETFFSTSPV